MTKRNDHTFAICAYKESPYLEECILSLKNQTVKSNIIMATSTPNEWIQGLAEKYEIPLYINTGEGGIAQDWNFAYRQAKTDYVTIAHQDDIYEPNYLKMIFGELKKGKDPIVVFTDYGELRDGEKVQKSTLLTIKRILLLPKNPQVCDWLIQKALERKYGEEIKLQPLDDQEEKEANAYIVNRFVK